MTDVSIRDLRNKGGDVVERASRGEAITITRAGKPVAELRPLPGPRLSAESLVARWRSLPPVDPTALRDDIAKLLDAAL
jgi:prevent-host-death family protein